MPRRFERHKRTKSVGWDTSPSRSDEVRRAALADPEPPKRSPGRKDTRHWCRGKEGVEHAPVLMLTTDPVTGREKTCKWRVAWVLAERAETAEWSCGHREVCASCGKVFRECWDLVRDGACPAYPGSLEQRHHVEAEAAQLRASRPQPRSRRRVITGPQGYRRRRT